MQVIESIQPIYNRIMFHSKYLLDSLLGNCLSLKVYSSQGYVYT